MTVSAAFPLTPLKGTASEQDRSIKRPGSLCLPVLLLWLSLR